MIPKFKWSSMKSNATIQFNFGGQAQAQVALLRVEIFDI